MFNSPIRGLFKTAAPEPKMSDDQARVAETSSPSLELKQLGRDTKSLKHKHKSKRSQQQRGESCTGSGKGSEPKRSPTAASPGRHTHAKRNAKANREDALRELLAGKIAEIEVGGDENLEGPIDLTGER
jgi:hypothetical protein